MSDCRIGNLPFLASACCRLSGRHEILRGCRAPEAHAADHLRAVGTVARECALTTVPSLSHTLGSCSAVTRLEFRHRQPMDSLQNIGEVPLRPCGTAARRHTWAGRITAPAPGPAPMHRFWPPTSSEIRYTLPSACVLTHTAPFQRKMNHIRDPPLRQLWEADGHRTPHRSTTLPGITDRLVVHFIWTCFIGVEGHGYFPCWIKAMQDSGVNLGLQWPTTQGAVGHVLRADKDT